MKAKKGEQKPAGRARVKARAAVGRAQARANGLELAPTPSANAEMVVRQGFVIDATSGSAVAIPEVVLLANREGFAYLARLFAHMEALAGSKSRESAAAAGVSLPRGAAPINARLSDDLDFRFAPLTSANRAATFKRYGVTLKSRQKGSLFDRYQNVAEQQYQKVARKISTKNEE